MKNWLLELWNFQLGFFPSESLDFWESSGQARFTLLKLCTSGCWREKEAQILCKACASGLEEALNPLFSSPLHSSTSLASCQSHRIWEALLEAGMANTYNFRIWKVEARGLGVWDHVWWHEVLSPARPQTNSNLLLPFFGKTVCVRYTSWDCAASGWDLCQVFPGFWPLIQKMETKASHGFARFVAKQ